MTMEIQHLMWKIEGIRDAFHTAVFADRDVDAALACVGEDGVLETVSGVVTARGPDDIRRFLVEDVIDHLPSGLEFTRVSKTSDQRRVAHEMTVRFTHDRELPWLLPGVAPTGRDVETSAVSVASFKHASKFGKVSSRILAYRITWDRLDVMAQLGLLDRETVAG
ncbi:nuclear transport factor 2 family protein [Pseudonocardia endophytica]|nr:nuclear transport factor 2 family protein [Pseudonocardia endophytica]